MREGRRLHQWPYYLLFECQKSPKVAPKIAPNIPAKSANGSVSKVDDQIGSKILTPTGKGSRNGMLRTNSMIKGGSIKAGRATKAPGSHTLDSVSFLSVACWCFEKTMPSTINAEATKTSGRSASVTIKTGKRPGRFGKR